MNNIFSLIQSTNNFPLIEFPHFFSNFFSKRLIQLTNCKVVDWINDFCVDCIFDWCFGDWINGFVGRLSQVSDFCTGRLFCFKVFRFKHIKIVLDAESNFAWFHRIIAFNLYILYAFCIQKMLAEFSNWRRNQNNALYMIFIGNRSRKMFTYISSSEPATAIEKKFRVFSLSRHLPSPVTKNKLKKLSFLAFTLKTEFFSPLPDLFCFCFVSLYSDFGSDSTRRVFGE